MASNLPAPAHRIKRLRMNGLILGSEHAFAMRNMLNRSIVDISDAIDTALEPFSQRLKEDEILHLERLNISLELNENEMLDRSKITAQIEKKIAEAIYESSNKHSETIHQHLNYPSSSNSPNTLPSMQAETKTFDEELQEVSKEEQVKTNAREALLYYLKHGRLPWFYGKDNNLEIQWKALIESTSILLEINDNVSSDSMQQHWIYFLLTNEYYEQLVQLVVNNNKLDSKSVVTILKESVKVGGYHEFYNLVILLKPLIANTKLLSSKAFINAIHALNEITATLKSTLTLACNAAGFDVSQFKEALVACFIHRASSIGVNAQYIKSADELAQGSHASEHIIDSESIQDEQSPRRPQNAKNEENHEQLDVLRIENAGLILFYPYLHRLFKSQQWLDDKHKLKPENIPSAFQALSYLASGSPRSPEYELVIAKLLLGLDLHELVLTNAKIDDALKEELDIVCSSLIHHWQQLGNTSIEGLRVSFIQRQGLLKRNDKNWQLHIERQAVDVLMDFLPFSISTVRLPWLRSPINVTW